VNRGELPNEYLLIPAFCKFIGNSLVPATVNPLEEGNGEMEKRSTMDENNSGTPTKDRGKEIPT
jgi:hypothetical protein